MKAGGIATIVIGLIKVLFTLLSLSIVDRIGRRSLLLIGSIGMTISLIILSISFNTSKLNNNNESNHNQSTMALISVCGAVASYSLGFGPITWLVVSELFPDEIRGRTLGKFKIFLCFISISLIFFFSFIYFDFFSIFFSSFHLS